MSKKTFELIAPGTVVYVREGSKDLAEVCRVTIVSVALSEGKHAVYSTSRGTAYYEKDLFFSPDDAFKDE